MVLKSLDDHRNITEDEIDAGQLELTKIEITMCRILTVENIGYFDVKM